MMFIPTLLAVSILSSVWALPAQQKAADFSAEVIASCCSTTTAMIHTVLDAVLIYTSQHKDNASQYIPTIANAFNSVSSSLDHTSFDLIGAPPITDNKAANITSVWTDSLSQQYVGALKFLLQVVPNDNVQPWKQLIVPIRYAQTSADRFYESVAKVNPTMPNTTDQKHLLDVAFHNAAQKLFFST